MPFAATKAVRILRPSSVRTGMFCRFGSDEESRPVVIAAKRVGGVDAAGLGLDVGRQDVGIGRFELGELAPVENALGERRCPVAARSSSTLAPVAQAPVLVFVPPARPNLPNRMSPSCLGEPRLKFSPAMLVHLGLEAAERLGEIAGQARQDLPVDRDAALLHAGEHRHHRPLQRLVDVGHALGDEAGLEDVPEPQGDVGVLGGVFGRLVDRHLVEGDLRAAGAGDVLEGDRRVAEPALGQARPCRCRAAAVERIGQQHGVVEGGDVDAVAGEDQHSRI